MDVQDLVQHAHRLRMITLQFSTWYNVCNEKGVYKCVRVVSSGECGPVKACTFDNCPCRLAFKLGAYLHLGEWVWSSVMESFPCNLTWG